MQDEIRAKSPIEVGSPKDGQQVELYVLDRDRVDIAYDPVQAERLGIGALTRKLLAWGVETRGAPCSVLSLSTKLTECNCAGIYPVPPEQRLDRQFHKIFFIWFSANFNILSYVSYLRNVCW